MSTLFTLVFPGHHSRWVWLFFFLKLWIFSSSSLRLRGQGAGWEERASGWEGTFVAHSHCPHCSTSEEDVHFTHLYGRQQSPCSPVHISFILQGIWNDCFLNVAANKLGTMGESGMGPVLSSDGYVSKTRMKAKICNNIACGSVKCSPFYTLKHNWGPQRAIAHIGYNYQCLPDKIWKHLKWFINSFNTISHYMLTWH